MGFFEAKYAISSLIFLKGLGIIWFIAFLSLFQQVDALYFTTGISPLDNLANYVKKNLGKNAFLKNPSIFLFKSNNLFIKLSTVIGMVSALLLIAGVLAPLNILILWVIYLSFINLGGEFLRYQWDILLLELSIYAFFLSFSKIPPVIGVICFQFFLFRFIFSSGLSKIRTDKNWRNLSSMKYHFETQPLPNPLSWYFHQFSLWFYRPITLMVLVLELLVPFSYLGPSNFKFWGFILGVSLQVLIILSGNFCFFNFLTILLHFFLINDLFYPLKFLNQTSSNILLEIIFGVLLVGNIIRFLGLFFKKFESIRFFPQFCLINSYGLFAKMTTKRYEINLEGSIDGISWKKIPFKYKIEDPKVGGLQIAPLQPRLDWQMWFLALNPENLSPWFNDFLNGLFKGNKNVESLLGEYPFIYHPPKFIRINISLYRFSTIKEKKDSTNFWIEKKLSSFEVYP